MTAIESRDPTTSGHSGRVAKLTVGLAEKVDALDAGPFRDVRFTRDQLQEIRYASLLHDFGKVGVREKVLSRARSSTSARCCSSASASPTSSSALEAEHLRAAGAGPRRARQPELLAELDRAYEAPAATIDAVLRMIVQANEPTILEEESFRP